MFYKKMWVVWLLSLTAAVSAREYAVSHSVPEDMEGTEIGKVTLSLYGTAEAGEVLEVHQLPAGQWRLQAREDQPGHPRRVQCTR